LGLLRLLAHRIGLLREALPIGGDLQPRSLITHELGFLSLQPAFLCLLEILIGARLLAIGQLSFGGSLRSSVATNSGPPLV
jgi:hypothetical protein